MLMTLKERALCSCIEKYIFIDLSQILQVKKFYLIYRGFFQSFASPRAKEIGIIRPQT